MTFYYKTYSWSQGDAGVPEETRKLWEHISDKKNWRIVQLPNGFYQAEYIDLDETSKITLDNQDNCIRGSTFVL